MSSPYTVSNDNHAVYVNQMEPVRVAYPVANRDPALENQKDYVLWSFFNTIFCNVFCLGFLALVYSIKARDRKVANDMHGAAHYASTAKNFNIAVSIFFAICAGITLISILLIVVSARPPR